MPYTDQLRRAMPTPTRDVATPVPGRGKLDSMVRKGRSTQHLFTWKQA